MPFYESQEIRLKAVLRCMGGDLSAVVPSEVAARGAVGNINVSDDDPASVLLST